MQKFLQIIILFLVPFTFQAQDSKNAKELLDQVAAKVRSYDNITLDFKYSYTSPKDNINQESRGDVTLKDSQYYLNFMGITRISDGKKVYTINPEDEEISISRLDENSSSEFTPSKILTFFSSGYKYSWDIPQNVKGRKIQYIKLLPLSNKDSRKEILLGIDVQTKHIYNMIETSKNGARKTFTINSFKTNQPLSKNQFTFTESKYPNYYINKLD